LTNREDDIDIAGATAVVMAEIVLADERIRLLEMELASERRRTSRLVRKVGRLQVKLETARANLLALRSSWSWRLTHPMRGVTRALRRLSANPRRRRSAAPEQ
jgi:hypothetical protein